MASEKRTSINFQFNKDNQTGQLVVNLTEDSSTGEFIASRQTITTASFQAITTTGLSSIDLISLKNADLTNYVEVSIDSGGSNKIAKLTAGRGMFLPAYPSVTYYAKANTASCIVQVLAVGA